MPPVLPAAVVLADAMPALPEGPMAVLIKFWVHGEPAPQGSKRAFRHAATNKIMMVESSAKVKPWRQAVAHEASQAMGIMPPVASALRMTAVFYFLRPKYHYNSKGGLKPTAPAYVAKTPDLSKLQRSTEDAMTGIVYRDDSQIVSMEISKRYACETSAPGASITLEIIE